MTCADLTGYCFETYVSWDITWGKIRKLVYHNCHTTPLPLRDLWTSLNPSGVKSARDADFPFVDNHVSVTAPTSSFFDSTILQKDVILLDIDLTFIVAIRTLII